jgi:hypothetical protein
MDAWRWLACPHCAARLERKNPRFLVALSSFLMVIIVLTTQFHRFAILAYVFIVATIILMVVELMRPQLQLRKPPPKPEIRLNINGPTT